MKSIIIKVCKKVMCYLMHFQLSVKMIVIITEKFQVNIFNKINNLVKELSKVEVHRLSEIRVIGEKTK
ncbi:MAG: hypothetical protein IIB07_03315 [Bacteroidetes bacterium]|nr:hypothetical protein [Bacteroidota bacterium]